MKNLRDFFPFFKNSPELIYFDNAGTTLKLKSVVEKIVNYYNNFPFNNHTVINHSFFLEIERTIELVRKSLATFINGEVEEISFVPSATHGLNFLALSLENFLKKGDEILLNYLEHSSNIFPWEYLAKKKKAKVFFLPINKKFSIDIRKIKTLVNKKTRLISLFHISNSFGSTNQIEKISKIVKKINPNCLIIVDACQSFRYCSIDVKKWKIDALVLSSHKSYGPTGLGVVWMKKQLEEKIEEVLWGGGKKKSPIKVNNEDFKIANKFEVGTLPLAQIFGFKESLEFLKKSGKFIIKKEKILRKYMLLKLKELPIKIYNEKVPDAKSVIFNLEKQHPHDVVNYLSKKNFILRFGNFCCPYLSLIIKEKSCIRISLAFYNKKEEVDYFIRELSELIYNPKKLISF